VIHLPRISNFDDFDPLQAEPGVQVRYVRSLDELGDPTAIILPGTKATCADLEWLQTNGLGSAILAHATRGGAVVGICGGYQMLGRAIHDPLRIESSATTVPGLGLLAIETTFQGQKETSQVAAKLTGGPGWLSRQTGQVVIGYEIHMGSTSSSSHWLTITQRGNAPVDVADGATNSTGEFWGCYLHGLFENPIFRRAWLASLGWESDPTGENSDDWFSNAIDDLADQVESAIDMEKLEEILWEN
jgi:adenosylcobyric acid synthase